MKFMVISGFAVVLGACVGEWQQSTAAGMAAGVFLLGLNEVYQAK